MRSENEIVRAHDLLNQVILGRLPEAAEAYREAVKLHPEYAQAHVMLGLTLASLGQIEEAAEFFREALEIQPNNATAHFNLARLLEGQGKTEEALGHYQQATLGTDAAAERMAREAILQLQSQR